MPSPLAAARADVGQSIVVAHGGELRVEPKEEPGATFTFTLLPAA